MKYILVNVLGNFGEYKNNLIPVTDRKEYTTEIIDTVIRAKYADIVLAYKIIADVVYR